MACYVNIKTFFYSSVKESTVYLSEASLQLHPEEVLGNTFIMKAMDIMDLKVRYHSTEGLSKMIKNKKNGKISRLTETTFYSNPCKTIF